VSDDPTVSPELISVLIPVRDPRFLGEALESVLAQAYRPIEVVVVDSSEVGARGLVESFGPVMRYEWQPPAGIAAARNRAVELATGDLLTFLDSDDLFEPERLSLQAEALDQDRSLEAVFGWTTEFVEPGLSDVELAALREPVDASPSHLVWTMLIRRAAFDRIGPFEMGYVVGETVEWYARARSLGLRSAMIDRVVARRRLHNANTGLLRWDARDDFVRVARSVLERRRSATEGSKEDTERL
jgi:glycosyltransferase involved in cell wall biosynthesis